MKHVGIYILKSKISKKNRYSIGKVFKSVEYHEEGFKLCHQMHMDKNVDSVPLTSAIISILTNWDHFANNTIISTIFVPIIDALARLENESSNLGDIWVQLILIKKQVSEAQVPERFLDFKMHTLAVISKWALKYDEPIYLIAFFLCPKFRKVSTSKKYPLKNIILFIVELGACWGLTQGMFISKKPDDI